MISMTGRGEDAKRAPILRKAPGFMEKYERTVSPSAIRYHPTGFEVILSDIAQQELNRQNRDKKSRQHAGQQNGPLRPRERKTKLDEF